MAESGSRGQAGISRIPFGCLAVAVVAVVVVGGVWLLQGGGTTGLLSLFRKDQTVVDFRDLEPPGLVVLDVERMDTDGDEEQEWLVTYQYDLVGSLNPVASVIYDAESDGGLATIVPYPLKVPSEDYLGEGQISIVQEDLLQDKFAVKTANELVVTDGKTLSVFAVADVSPTKVGRAIEYPNPYSCQGFFKAGLRVARQGNVIAVYDRAGNDRSQFALKRVYKPSGGSYFYPDKPTLLPPAEASIEFAFGMPDDILSTPYPEKLVLAFYQTLTQAEGDVTPYLTVHGQQLFVMGSLAYGSPWSRLQTSRVLVQEISYVSPESASASPADVSADPEAAVVSVKALFVGPGGSTTLRRIDWHMVKVETQWKLHDAVASDA